MDWKFFSATFLTIFLAELGDKTQFAAMALGAQGRSIWVTALAVVSALSVAGILGVLFGKFLAQWLDPLVMRWVSGTLFILMGVWILFFEK
ncbi:MAG: TMEM165/GDT1 family protein [Bdellovibrionaceae bacterium]|nr:TMEM165/GDT1 family protein [Pseudobdellovibrionaceae bacterium]MDW8190130.1 TMEM165/GDT1 family protein [Pseudobdellovibrionaceae bacterium]